MHNVLFYILIFVFGMIISLHIRSDAHTILEQNHTEPFYELKVHRMYKIGLGLAMLIIALLMVLLIVGLVYGEQTVMVNSLKLIAFFGVLALPIWIYIFQHKLIFDEKILVSRGMNGEITRIEWSEIVEIVYHKRPLFSNLLRLKEKHGKTIEVAENLVGFVSLLEMMERKTKWNRQELGIF